MTKLSSGMETHGWSKVGIGGLRERDRSQEFLEDYENGIVLRSSWMFSEAVWGRVVTVDKK